MNATATHVTDALPTPTAHERCAGCERTGELLDGLCAVCRRELNAWYDRMAEVADVESGVSL